MGNVGNRPHHLAHVITATIPSNPFPPGKVVPLKSRLAHFWGNVNNRL